MDVQRDMVALCVEYVRDKAERVFIFGSIENGHYMFDVFYAISGSVVMTHEITQALQTPELEERKRVIPNLLRTGISDLERLEEVCEEFGQPVPTELRLVYDARRDSLEADYKYDPVYTHTKDLDSSDVFNAWFEEVKRENGE